MLQIKTIRNTNPAYFDENVNEALQEGWMLTRRLTLPDGFVAELEKVVITEAERGCDNCKYCDCDACLHPCDTCEDASHWEELEG